MSKEFISKMKNIEERLLNFLDQRDNVEENYYNLFQIIKDENILTNRYDFKIFLYLLNKISLNHHRFPNFLNKIDQINRAIKEEMKQFFSNEELFKIFKNNKRILLFLIEENIVKIDQYIYLEITNEKYTKMQYAEYFSFEIKKFIEDEKKNKGNPLKVHQNLYEKIEGHLSEDFDIFDKKRKKGENEGYLYNIIQNDLIDEFITYINKENYPLNSYVEESIFETNEFLLKKKETKLIEYAAFFGSNQIFKYLYKNNAQMTSNLWEYAIHGCDEEIIHILEEYDINASENCLKESIKCHHNYITVYIEENLQKNEEHTNNEIFYYYLKYYNFMHFDDKNEKELFIYACKYDYYRIVEYLLNMKKIDINKIISIIF